MQQLSALALCLLLLCAPAGAATLTTSIESTTLEMGDSVTLVISLTGGDSTQPPDLSGLAKDFDILDRRRGSRVTNEDGKRIVVNDWVLTLAPRRAGTLTIPAFSLSGASTQPIRIEVTSAAKTGKDETRSIFVETEVGKGAVYAQGEIPIYVRVYDSLGMRSGAISQVRADGASFREEGQQEAYFRTLGKTRYHVIQQTYIMTPQRSGTIEIDPVTLTANVPMLYNTPPSQMQRQYGAPNAPMPWIDGSMIRGQEIKLHSDKLKVEVLPRPAGAQGWFLPARSVSLKQTWSSPPEKARVGETLTRTITIDAVGASPNQLPPLDLPEVDGLRQYQEDRDAQNSTIDRQPGATLKQVVAVVPSRAGTFTLPAISIGWWNVDRKTQEQTVLPAVTVTVAPAPGVAAPPPAAQAPSATSGLSRTEADAAMADTPGFEGTFVSRMLSVLSGLGRLGIWGTWPLALAAGLAVLLAIALAPRLLRRIRTGGSRPARIRRLAVAPAPRANRAESERALARAARASDAAGTHAAYLALCRSGVDGSGLAEPRPRTPEFETALRDLRAHLYGTPGAGWNGRRFLAAWRTEASATAKAGKRRGPDGLRPLYPGA